MKAVLIGTVLAGLVVLIARAFRRRHGEQSDEPMLPEPDTDWIN